MLLHHLWNVDIRMFYVVAPLVECGHIRMFYVVAPLVECGHIRMFYVVAPLVECGHKNILCVQITNWQTWHLTVMCQDHCHVSRPLSWVSFFFPPVTLLITRCYIEWHEIKAAWMRVSCFFASHFLISHFGSIHYAESEWCIFAGPSSPTSTS